MQPRLLTLWRGVTQFIAGGPRPPGIGATALCTALALLTMPATAAPPAAADAPPDINDSTVGIVTGTVTGTYIQFASDLSTVLDSPGKLRILAVLGKGSLQNVEDILKVRGIDLGIVQSDVLAYIKKEGTFPEIQNKLQYITKLYNEEFHLLTSADIGKLDDLRGKKVNFGSKGSGIAITSSIVFDLLKIKVEATYDDPSVALEKLRRGEIAATAGVYGKPAKIYDGVKAGEKIKFLPIPPSLELSKVYFPSTLTSSDYPDLIRAEEPIDTIAVGAVMVVYGWDQNSWRYKKVARFVDLFFNNLEQLQKPPRHQKWQEVNLRAKVPGWVRFPAAEEWLARAGGPGGTGQTSATADRAQFERFLTEQKTSATPGGDEGRQKLFEAYEAWKRTKSN